MGQQLLIVGINYAPEETGIGPYTTGLAEHMVRRDWEVSVATGMPHYPRWQVDAAYKSRFRVTEERCHVTLHRFRQYTPAQQSCIGRSLYEASFFLQTTTIRRSTAKSSCVLGIVPSLSGGAAAALIARRCRVPFGIVFQDLVGQAASQSGIPGGGKVARSRGFLSDGLHGEPTQSR